MKADHDTTVDAARFIEGMRQVPSVVTVVTTGNAQGIWGITIGSFVSLSINPPLICFNVQKDAAIHDPIVEAGEYAIHVLRAEQSALSDRFARADIRGGQLFEGISFDLTDSGTPVLRDALVTFHCRPFDVLPGGDHSILVGRVCDVLQGRPGEPVLYHQRAYYGIGRHISDHE